MIYNGQIKDPRNRYYNQLAQVNPFSPQISPRYIQRYARYKAQPVNLNGILPNSNNLSNSNIYTKQGLLKRNQVGWDAVKLTQYVTQQFSQDFSKNQKMLQKFRLQAQQSRRMKKFGHAFQSRLYIPQQTKPYYLPPITPVVHQRQPNDSQAIYDPQKQQNQYQQEQQHHYRNVGVNTQKTYQKNQLQKYLKLMNKYQAIKQKYDRQKSLRRIQKRKYKQKIQQKQRQIKSNEKIKDIEASLANISVKLQTSNEILSEQLKTRQVTKDMHNLNGTITTKMSKNTKVHFNTNRRLKTQPELSQKQHEEYQQNQRNRQNASIESLRNIEIPKNPLSQIPKQNLKIKSPTVVYSSKYNNIADTKFLTKYVRQ